MSIGNFSVSRPITTIMIYVGLCVLSVFTIAKIPVELMPSVGSNKITIMIGIRGGLPPEEIESRVTKIVEEAVATSSNLETIESSCEKERSTTRLMFRSGTNMNFANLEVREKFSKIKNDLPKEIEKPVIARYEENDAPVIILAVSGDKNIHTPETIRRKVDNKIKEVIQRVNGVANVRIAGGRERKILVEFSRDRLQAFAIPILDAIDKIGKFNVTAQAGEIAEYSMNRTVITKGTILDLDGFKKIPLRPTKYGSILTIGDIADVKDDYNDPQSYSRVDKAPVVSLYVQKESNANTVSVVEGVIKAAEDLKPFLVHNNLWITPVSNQAEFISEAIHSVQKSLLYGAFLAALVLLVFLRSIPVTGIISTAIPISVLITLGLMYFQNLSINIMTLSGLSLGIGMLVDSAIVVIENIDKKRAEGSDRNEAAILGSDQVILALIASTATTIVVFIPIVYVNEEIRRMYSGLALTVTYSLIASLFVAITLVPMLMSKLKNIGTENTGFCPWFPKVISAALKIRYITVALAGTLLFFSILTAKGMKTEFLGSADQGKFTLYIKLKDGARLSICDDVTSEVEEILSDKKQFPEIKTVTSYVEGWSSRVFITLLPAKERKRTTEEVKEAIRSATKEAGKANEPFIYFDPSPEEGLSSKKVVVDIYGYDSMELSNLADEFAGKMQELDFLSDVKIRRSDPRPEFHVVIDKFRLSRHGLNVRYIADSLHAQIRGLRCTTFRTEAKEVEVIGRLQEKFRQKRSDIRISTVVNPKGEIVPIKDICRFDDTEGPSEIWRKNKNRMLQVSANSSLPLEEAVTNIRKKLSDIKLPKDYYYDFIGEYKKMKETRKQLFFAMLLTFALVFMVLASLFESYYQPIIIMITVPLAFIGAIFFLHWTGNPISMGVMIGGIMLAGIVVNNAIILVDHINEEKENGILLDEAIVGASHHRLRPILMTALTTVLGLVPMAISKSEGAGLWSPLAITVIGGITFSTLLTLVIIPCIYKIFEDVKKVGLKLIRL